MEGEKIPVLFSTLSGMFLSYSTTYFRIIKSEIGCKCS